MKTNFVLFLILVIICSISTEKLFTNEPCIENASVKGVCGFRNTITVTGTASRSIPNSLLKIGLLIETKDKITTTALQMNNQISQSIDSLLVDLKIEKKNIVTTSFNINSEYQSLYHQENGTYTQEFLGFIVSNNLEIIVNNFEIGSKLIDQAISIGAKSITYINFSSDPKIVEEMQNVVLEEAAIDARKKAETIVKPLGVKLDEILEIVYGQEAPSSSPFPRMEKAMSADMNGPTLYGNQNVITTSVRIVFKIKQE